MEPGEEEDTSAAELKGRGGLDHDAACCVLEERMVCASLNADYVMKSAFGVS